MRGKYIQIPLVCISCGVSFTRRRSRITQYCSRQCKARSAERISAFWLNAKPSGDCLLWQASKNRKGYGWWNWCKRPTLAHIVAFELTHGSIPDGLKVCHSCDKPSCINPQHLFLGTAHDNTQDMVRKGRVVRGERASPAKLTEEQARSILQRVGTGERQITLAREFGVSRSSIGRLISGDTWKHLRSHVAPKAINPVK